MTGPLPHIRQVHRGDPISHLPGAPQIVPFDTRSRGAPLLLAGLIDRPDHQATPPPRTAGRLIQPSHREPAHHPHRRKGVPHRPVEQPLGPLRAAVSCLLGDCPPIPLRQAARHRRDVLARLQPRLHPHKESPQQLQQLSPLLLAQPSTYPGGTSRPRLCCRHILMIARRLPYRSRFPTLRPRSRPERMLPY
jgi:hypothetical protein